MREHMEPIEIQISAILYEDGGHWIAQGLEYDITAQATSLTDLPQRFAMKVVAEVAISLDLERKPLEGLGEAPTMFWRMFEKASVDLSIDAPLLKIAGDGLTPRIVPRMKLGQLQAA